MKAIHSEEIAKQNEEVKKHTEYLDKKYGKKLSKLLTKMNNASKEENKEDMLLLVVNKLKQHKLSCVPESVFISGLVMMMLMTSELTVIDAISIHSLLGSAINSTANKFTEENVSNKQFIGKDNGMKN